jgi:4-diphosphocytidyl-2-C-methyl-D-erythritol kinase
MTELASIVGLLSLEDTLTLKPAPHTAAKAITLHCHAPQAFGLGSLPPAANLAYRAAAAYLAALPPQQVAAWPALELSLTKHIPTQAGLGGGSSNAAVVLLGLQQLAQQQGLPALAPAQLGPLAATLGSDVPLFLTALQNPDSPQWVGVTGRGEHCEGLAAPAWRHEWQLLLVKPWATAMPTAQAYGAVKSQQAYSGTEGVAAHQALVQGLATDCDGKAQWRNDFEAPVEALCPALATVRQQLMALGATYTLLCGSGAAVAGFFKKHVTSPSASQQEALLPSDLYWQQWATLL